MKRWVLSLAALALFSTACGSTVQTSGAAGVAGGEQLTDVGLGDSEPGFELGQPLASDGGSAGLELPSGSEPGSGPASSGAGSAGSAGSSGSSGSSGGSAGSSSGTVSGGGAAGAGGTGGAAGADVPGVTRDSILIGTFDAEASDKALRDAGITGSAQGSNERKARALVETINARGAIAGRKLKLFVNKTTSSSTDESNCAAFTQDQRVFAVLDYGQRSTEEFRACLNKRGVLLLSDNGTFIDSKILQGNPRLWPVGGFNIERKIPALIDGLKAQGYFAPWNPQSASAAAAGEAKVGLLYIEEEFNKRQNPRLRAALAKHGLAFHIEFAIRSGSSSQADIKAAVLRFASEGVTHVLFNYEANGAFFGLFALNASSQGYYPRYGISSVDFPVIVKQNMPDHKVFNGLKGVGWLPYQDVDTPAALGELQKSCLKIFADKGQTPGDANEQTIMLINCDIWFKFERVVRAVGSGLSAAAFIDAVPGLGATPTYAWTRVDYSRHRDGIAAVNHMEYGQDCDCIRYTRTGIAIP